MRLIGNKTRLLGEIQGILEDHGVHGGTMLDIFSGTAAVGKHFKRLGFRVIANDLLPACYTHAVAAIEVRRYPEFAGLRARHRRLFSSRRFRDTFAFQQSFGLQRRLGPASGDRRRSVDSLPLAQAVHLLNEMVSPREGLVFRNYSPGGPRGARYFSEDNARRIDGILSFLRESRESGALSHHEHHLLLASLIDAADRVANISGTYGAYLKSWQRNALLPLSLEVPEVIESPRGHRACREDANELARRLKVDVLYVDPPYTDRQYAANYHVPQILAEYSTVDDLDGYEAALYGKTGLRPYQELRSLYCVPASKRSGGRDVLGAMRDLILSSRARCIVLSYNEEGLLGLEQIGSILEEFSGTARFDLERNMRRIPYRRFRSDSDRGSGQPRGKRQYRVLDGRERNEIHEWLFFAARGGEVPSRPLGRRARRRANGATAQGAAGPFAERREGS